MKPIEKDELYDNLTRFLKTKGLELKDGSYAQTVQKSCRMLADIINLGQQGVESAKTGIETKLDQVRQVIHEKTAPKPPVAPATPPPVSEAQNLTGSATAAAAAATAKTDVPAAAAAARKSKAKVPKGKIRPKKAAGTVKPTLKRKPRR